MRATARATTAERAHHPEPLSVYARLRKHGPVYRSVILGSWILTRYDDVLAVARDHERFSNDPRWRNTAASVLPPATDGYSILLVDPPEHTRLRKVAARGPIEADGAGADHRSSRQRHCVARGPARRGGVDRRGRAADGDAGDASHARDRRGRGNPLALASIDRTRLPEMIATHAERKTARIAGESMTGHFREHLVERACGEGIYPGGVDSRDPPPSPSHPNQDVSGVRDGCCGRGRLPGSDRASGVRYRSR